jgi:septal ring factor EnvC (AmiA/AmiB activator)
VKFQSLQDLKHVQKQIAEAQAKAAAEAAARAAELKRIEAEKPKKQFQNEKYNFELDINDNSCYFLTRNFAIHQ